MTISPKLAKKEPPVRKISAFVYGMAFAVLTGIGGISAFSKELLMKTKIMITFFLMILPLLSKAECPDLKGNVVIFGGRGATTSQMQQCYPDFTSFSNVEGEQYIRCLARKIDQSEALPDGQKFVIAGHSSGAVQAERLAQSVKDKSKIRLVLLEGFGSPLNQKGVETTCWYAQNGKLQGMNASSMKNPKVCLGQIKSFVAPQCQTSLCLHLSLVNSNVEGNLNLTNVLTHGLKNCQGNFEWLNH